MVRHPKTRGTTLSTLLPFVWAAWILLACGCGGKQAQNELAFYHWKTAFSPSNYENSRMEGLDAQKIYIKYFDIDQEAGQAAAIPMAKVQFKVIPSQKVVPTIYITNRAMRGTGEAKADELARKCWKLIQNLHPAALPPIEEVQIDCDWTASTREAYFHFLKALKQEIGEKSKLTATIRLHQLKHHQLTGVPPVDRGMLMYYNMGDLEDPEEYNSILDIAEGRKYLNPNSPYPLELDIALPIFAWGVLIQQGKPSKLMHNLSMAELDSLPWLHKIGPVNLEVDSSHYLRSHYLLPGDQIRLEAIEAEALGQAAEDLRKALPRHKRTIAFYHLDSLNLSQFPDSLLLDALK